MERGLSFCYGMRGGWVVKYTIKEARVMWIGLEGHMEHNPFDHIVPMMGGLTEAIKRFLEEPVFIFLKIRVANWRSYHSKLIIWKGGVAERVLKLTLL